MPVLYRPSMGVSFSSHTCMFSSVRKPPHTVRNVAPVIFVA